MRPIPPRILTTSGTLKVPISADRYGKAEYSETNFSKTHLQPSSSVKKTRDNREVVLRSLLFYDVRGSLPRGLDFDVLKTQAEKVGSDMLLLANGLEYIVETVEMIPDDTGKPHHYELGLV